MRIKIVESEVGVQGVRNKGVKTDLLAVIERREGVERNGSGVHD